MTGEAGPLPVYHGRLVGASGYSLAMCEADPLGHCPEIPCCTGDCRRAVADPAPAGRTMADAPDMAQPVPQILAEVRNRLLRKSGMGTTA